MGNDGGSFVKRTELVKTRKKPEQRDEDSARAAKWFFCALSKKPLQEPVVACALGKLYNKDALLEYLLDKSAYGDGDKICGHIRSLKDVKQIVLTPNPSLSPSATTAPVDSSAPTKAPFVCPLTLKEMNGMHRFVYLRPSGCVFSEAGLRAISSSDTPTCPTTGARYDPTKDVVELNPKEEDQLTLLHALLAAREAEGEGKKKKRKADREGEGKAKKAKKAPVVGPALGPTSDVVLGARKAVAAALKESSVAKPRSDAVQSIFGPKDKKDQQTESWMTRGTWTRYA